MPEDEATAATLAGLAEWVVVATPGPLSELGMRAEGTGISFIGRESLGTYTLHVYASDLFAVRRVVTDALRAMPIEPQAPAVEDRLRDLAIQSPGGVLRLGRGTATAEHIGVMVAISVAARIEA